MRTVNLRLPGTALLALVLLTAAGCSRVKDDWKAAQTTDSAEAYQQFVRDHADSEFSSQAESRIQQLLEDTDWKAAAKLDTRDGYEQFVAQHADGKWAQEARVRIENFKLAAGPASQPATKPAPTMKPAAQPGSKPAAQPAASGNAVSVQLGAFGSTAAAEAAWAKVKSQWPKQSAGLSARYEPVQTGGKTLVRLRATLPDRGQAEQFCETLRKQKHACLITG
jgi:cell division septation protein DedD